MSAAYALVDAAAPPRRETGCEVAHCSRGPSPTYVLHPPHLRAPESRRLCAQHAELARQAGVLRDRPPAANTQTQTQIQEVPMSCRFPHCAGSVKAKALCGLHYGKVLRLRGEVPPVLDDTTLADLVAAIEERDAVVRAQQASRDARRQAEQAKNSAAQRAEALEAELAEARQERDRERENATAAREAAYEAQQERAKALAGMTAMQDDLGGLHELCRLYQDDIHAQRRVIAEACALLHVTDDDESDWPKLPQACVALLDAADQLRMQLRDAQSALAEEQQRLQLMAADVGAAVGDPLRTIPALVRELRRRTSQLAAGPDLHTALAAHPNSPLTVSVSPSGQGSACWRLQDYGADVMVYAPRAEHAVKLALGAVTATLSAEE